MLEPGSQRLATVTGSTADIARFFDREACCASARPAGHDLSHVSKALLESLAAEGVSDRSVLDVGCGTGALSIAFAQRGAREVTGIDLSAGSIAQARSRAAAELAAQPRFDVGDAATVHLDIHDVVVLNKVVCCYFDPGSMLANVLPAAGSVFVISLPHSRGLRGSLARLALGAENAWRWLRRDPFRAFVHDVDAVVGDVMASGLLPARARDLGLWCVLLFTRGGH